jgi:amidase
MFPLAHANDGGGSNRIPASCCGLVGLKPARARVPRHSTSWQGAVVEGVVTRTVADTAAVLDAIAGPDTYAWNNAPPPQGAFLDQVGADGPRLRVGVMDHGPGGMPIDPEAAEAARKLARTLEEQGHSVEPAEVAVLSEGLIEPFVVWVAASLGEEHDVDWDKVEPHIAAQWQQANETSAAAYVAAARTLELHSRELTAGFRRDYDVLVTPTLAIQPPPAGAILEQTHANPEAPSEIVIGMVAFNAWVNITGLPSIQLPVHEAAGVPIGAQIVGSPWDEATLLRLAAEVEQATPWADRKAGLATA